MKRPRRIEVSKRHGSQDERSCGGDQTDPVELQSKERADRSRGHVTEQGGGSEGNEDQAEGRRRTHFGDRRAGVMEGGETPEVVGRQSRVGKNW